MKKILLLLLSAALLITGCSRLTPKPTPSPAPAAETPDVYVQPPEGTATADYLSLGYELMAEERLGELRLGMKEAQVVALLGQTGQMSETELWAADGLLHSTWDYPSLGLSIGMAGAEGGTEGLAAISLSAMAPCTLKTLRGIGIGSTKEAVLAAYGNLTGEENAVTEERIVMGSVYGGMIATLENGLVASLFIGSSAE